MKKRVFPLSLFSYGLFGKKQKYFISIINSTMTGVQRVNSTGSVFRDVENFFGSS